MGQLQSVRTGLPLLHHFLAWSGPYSQGIRAGNYVYISGMLPLDPKVCNNTRFPCVFVALLVHLPATCLSPCALLCSNRSLLQTGKIVGGDIRGQTDRALQNLKAVTQAGGSNLDLMLKVQFRVQLRCSLTEHRDFPLQTTVYLRNMTDFPAMNEARNNRRLGFVLIELIPIGLRSLPHQLLLRGPRSRTAFCSPVSESMCFHACAGFLPKWLCVCANAVVFASLLACHLQIMVRACSGLLARVFAHPNRLLRRRC